MEPLYDPTQRRSNHANTPNVIAFDPLAVEQLLATIGPVTVAGIAGAISAKNVTAYLRVSVALVRDTQLLVRRHIMVWRGNCWCISSGRCGPARTRPINWGDPRDWSGFWWEVSGWPYRELAFGLPTNLIYRRVAAWAALLMQQFGWIGLGLGFFRLLYRALHGRQFV